MTLIKTKKPTLFISNLVEQVLFLDGKKFSFDMFPPKRVIYDDPSSFICQKTSRQVGKSTDIAAQMIGNGVARKNFRSVYIAPQSKHKSDFSHQRLNALMEGSPYVKNNYMSYRLVNNVDLKQLTNGSFMLLRHAYLSDLPLRGPSSDWNFWDEYQDANPAIFGIGQEMMSRSEFKRTMVTGTPKTSITPLEKVWQGSTKLEIGYKCQKCGKWNFPSMENIFEFGPGCVKCKTPLTPDKWEWVVSGDPLSEVQGYHYNKLSLSIWGDPFTNWKKDVWNKLHGPDGVRKSLREFKNEVLGEADDEATRPITESDLIKCSDNSLELVSLESLESKEIFNEFNYMELKQPVYCAIDWGTTNTTTSNTVLILGAPDFVDSAIIKVFHIKKFIGDESSYDYILNYIFTLNKIMPNIAFFAGDNGMGHTANSIIRNRLGPDKLFGFQFVANQKEKAKWHSVVGSSQEEVNSYYTVNKVTAYDQFFYEIKNKLWKFPNWEQWRNYAREILNVEQSFNEDKNKYIYTHLTDNPDDVPSALIYLRLLIELSYGINY